MKNILFICTGNTCRSPMAEELFKITAKKRGLTGWQADSAGVAAVSGSPISENSEKVLSEYGIDASNKRSKALSVYLIDQTELFVCMTESHAAALMSVGVQSEKIKVLNVPDPFGGDLDVYKNCAEQILSELDGLILFLKGFVVDKFSKGDQAEIEKIEKMCFSEPWSAEAVLESFKSGTEFFTVKKEGKAVGYGGVQITLDGGYVTNIAVLKEYRGLGLGKVITEKLINACKQKNLPFISLEVRVSNKTAINLYEGLGFECLGERKSFYNNPREDAYIYTLYF